MPEPNPTPQPEREFHFEAIAGLEAPMKKIIESMGDSLYEYDLILGEDASGRIPTLVFGDFLGRVKGKRVPTYFYSPGHWIPEGEKWGGVLEEYFNKIISREHATRPLVVTEYVYSGRSMGYGLRALNSVGIKADIATVLRHDPDGDALSKLAVKVWSGGLWHHGDPPLYKLKYNHYINGVTQSRGKDSPVSASPGDTSPRVRADIREAREDAKLLADKLYEWWIDKSSNSNDQ